MRRRHPSRRPGRGRTSVSRVVCRHRREVLERLLTCPLRPDAYVSDTPRVVERPEPDITAPEGLVGGLAGHNYSGNVSYCFWDTDTQTHGVTESIGANNGTIINVEGLPTVKMQMRRTFTGAGWDLSTSGT